MNKILPALFLCACFVVISFSQESYFKIRVTNDIEIIKLSDHTYIHASYAQIPPWGRVPSNGMIFINDGKAFLFDTPVTDSLTKDLVQWIQDTLRVRIIGFVPNHWHNDCMGGLNYLNSLGIESYSNELTREIAKTKNLPIPKHGFSDSLELNIGNKQIICNYFGPAHTIDNIVAWIPSEKILFGGCMVKELKSTSLGNIADADIKEWPKTIGKVLEKYKNAKIVIPGHGEYGGIELLKHTLELSSH